MAQIKLDYEPLRAAVARGDSAYIEVEARNLRDQHIAELLVRAANRARSVIMGIGRGLLAWHKHRYEAAPNGNRLLNFIRM